MSILLYGPPGTGKTSIAEGLAGVYNDEVWIPYAVEIGGQVISVYDPAIHRRVGEPSLGNKPNWGLYKHSTDARWVLCRRPRVIVGGELTIEMLDVQPDVINKCYSAPLQMKANNGVFVVDDFGRQLVPTDVLFNRWMVPLDRRVDFLSLAGGKKSEIPFDLFVVFVTNLHPAELGGAAFFRRIPNKIRVDYPTPGQFHEICRKVCQEFHLQYDMDAAEYLIQLLTVEFQRPLRACYPRDIVRQICWKARWEAKQPRFDRSTVSEACCDCFGFDVDCWTPGTEFEPSQPMLGTKPEQRARARTPVYS